VTGTTLLLVLVRCTVLPDSTLVIVTTNSETELVVIKVWDGVNVLVTVFVDWSSELVSSSELEGVRVDVVVVTATGGDEVGGTVIVDDVVVMVAEVVSLVTMTEVVEEL